MIVSPVAIVYCQSIVYLQLQLLDTTIYKQLLMFIVMFSSKDLHCPYNSLVPDHIQYDKPWDVGVGVPTSPVENPQ